MSELIIADVAAATDAFLMHSFSGSILIIFFLSAS
jgi:hypothetical protein